MWPFQSIHSFWTVARWRSSGAPRSRSVMGYGGNFMRADRSEDAGSPASFARPLSPENYMAKKPKALVLGVGAERGIGGAASRRFAKEGYHVLVAGRTTGKIDKVVDGIRKANGSATAVTVDGTPEARGIKMFDSAIADDAARAEKAEPDGLLKVEPIVDNYWHLHTQQRSAWTHEIDLRPYKETF